MKRISKWYWVKDTHDNEHLCAKWLVKEEEYIFVVSNEPFYHITKYDSMEYIKKQYNVVKTKIPEEKIKLLDSIIKKL